MDTQKVLIWGKTYPELSKKYRETVCTGGCLESGKPIRLYPVPLRYLSNKDQYRLYDWIEVPIYPSQDDHRPESYKVDSRRIRKLGHLDTGKRADWAARRGIIFRDDSWHFECVNDLVERQKRDKSSLGFVRVGSVERVFLEQRTEEERLEHERKLQTAKSQPDLFGYEAKDLEFFPYRVKITWKCERLGGFRPCPSHTNVILDWGLGELGRRDGEQAALKKMEQISDLRSHDLAFFMGNIKAHQQNFTIVGIWYPKKKHTTQKDLFFP